jgi:hypothetical protein
MQAMNHNEYEYFFNESLVELESVNKQLAKLSLRKEELTQEIIGALQHDHEGQKTYEYDVWKIEIKTPVVYSLNKKLYESGKVNIPDNFNPIKTSISYTIDKKLCEQYMDNAPKVIRDALIELIEKKPGKAGVILKERI